MILEDKLCINQENDNERITIKYVGKNSDKSLNNLRCFFFWYYHYVIIGVIATVAVTTTDNILKNAWLVLN